MLSGKKNSDEPETLRYESHPFSQQPKIEEPSATEIDQMREAIAASKFKPVNLAGALNGPKEEKN